MKKREHKEALDRQRAEDERREAARQARKLEFLISQTELYSHFVGNKLKSKWILPLLSVLRLLSSSASELEGGDAAESGQAPSGADYDNVDKAFLPDIDFDDGASPAP